MVSIESSYIELRNRQIGSATINYNLVNVTGSSVTYLSNGSGWYQATKGTNYSFPAVGSSLKYKIESTGSGAITNLTVRY